MGAVVRRAPAHHAHGRRHHFGRALSNERAQLAAAALIGVTLARRILRAEPLASLDTKPLLTYLNSMLTALLTQDNS